MSIYSDSVDGGILITWKIENFLLIHELWGSKFTFEWAKTERKWTVQITVIPRGTNKKSVTLSILYLDKFLPVYLSGTLTAVNGNKFSQLGYFDEYSFVENQNSEMIKTTQPEGIDFEKQCLINNGSLTLCIKLWDPNINDLVAVEYFVSSPNNTQMCSFQWPMKGVRDWDKNENCIECSTVIPMKFTVFPTNYAFKLGIKLQIEDHKLYANILSFENVIINGSYRLQLERKERMKSTLFDTEWKKFVVSLGNSQKDFIKEEKWDYLTTECVVKIEIFTNWETSFLIEKICYEPNCRNFIMKNAMSEREQHLNNDLQNSIISFYNEQKFCDIILCTDSKRFPCHKVVLCARSSVFQTMFKNDMTEKKTNVVNIDDTEPRILGMFLDYLYSDNLKEDDFSSVMELYAVADKYAVSKLQKICSNIIVCSLCVDNVCEALDLADSHQDEDLKKEIILFFCEHAKEILNSPGWQKLKSDKTSLAIRIVEIVLNKIL